MYIAVQISCGMCAEEEAGWTAITDINELKRVFKLFLFSPVTYQKCQNGCKGNVFRDSTVVFLDKIEIFFYVNEEKLIPEKCLSCYKRNTDWFCNVKFGKHTNLLASVICGKSYRKTTGKQPTVRNYAIVCLSSVIVAFTTILAANYLQCSETIFFFFLKYV